MLWYFHTITFFSFHCWSISSCTRTKPLFLWWCFWSIVWYPFSGHYFFYTFSFASPFRNFNFYGLSALIPFYPTILFFTYIRSLILHILSLCVMKHINHSFLSHIVPPAIPSFSTNRCIIFKLNFFSSLIALHAVETLRSNVSPGHWYLLREVSPLMTALLSQGSCQAVSTQTLNGEFLCGSNALEGVRTSDHSERYAMSYQLS